MAKLKSIVRRIEEFYRVKELDIDPQMAVFYSGTYEKINFDWESYFEKDFVKRLNGLMIKGSETVNNIYLSAFPTPDVITKFLDQAKEGDVFFAHHPIYMSCGDPHGRVGDGWKCILPKYLDQFKKRNLSYYSLHSPLDYHSEVGTRAAIIKSLNAEILEDFYDDGRGPHGAICQINPVLLSELEKRLIQIFDIEYLDKSGRTDKDHKVSKLAVVSGSADNTDLMKIAQDKGVDVYIAGEVNSRFDTEFGRENQKKIDKFMKQTKIPFIGVSHSASEYLTMKTQMREWFRQQFNVKVHLITQDKWWY